MSWTESSETEAADRWRQEGLDAAFPSLGKANEFLHNPPKRKTQ
jgi:hypothetical protein